MDTKVFSLRSDKKGRFSVVNLFSDFEMVLISLPHRASIMLSRFGSVIAMDFDLGWIPSDDIRVCEIDISEKDYQSAIRMNPEFMARARSFENSFHVEKFVRAKAKYSDVITTQVFGELWQDQVYIHLAEPTWEMVANIEFSVIQADYIDFFGEQRCLTEPMRTLVSSLRLHGQQAHYFLFVEWDGDEKWRYSKNFFFDNKEGSHGRK